MNNRDVKLKVKPEGRIGGIGVWLVEKSDLKEWLVAQEFKEVHFIAGANTSLLIGADCAVEDLLSEIDLAERLAVLTGNAQRGNMRHALSVIRNNKLEIYDIGAITDNDLEIVA